MQGFFTCFIDTDRGLICQPVSNPDHDLVSAQSAQRFRKSYGHLLSQRRRERRGLLSVGATLVANCRCSRLKSLLQQSNINPLRSLRLCEITHDKPPNQADLHLAKTSRTCQIGSRLLQLISYHKRFIFPLRSLRLCESTFHELLNVAALTNLIAQYLRESTIIVISRLHFTINT